MTWTIQIPHRSRDESLTAVGGHVRVLPGDDREVARQVVLGAYADGLATAGDLLDRLRTMTAAERRATLDKARGELGLESTDVIDTRRSRTNPLVLGPAPLTPTTELVPLPGGGYAERPLNPSRWTIGPSGQVIDVGMAEADAARQQATEESRRRQLEAMAAERTVDADAHAAHVRAEHERIRAELPPHLR
jgi:hypothetical protein